MTILSMLIIMFRNVNNIRLMASSIIKFIESFHPVRFHGA